MEASHVRTLDPIRFVCPVLGHEPRRAGACPGLSVVPDHDNRAVSSGRADRRGRADRCRGNARLAGAARDHRECLWRGRNHRCCSPRARGTGVGIGQPVSHVFSGAVYNVRYDLLNDFEPIALLSSSPLWVLGSASLPAHDIRELIAWLKANPDKASFGTIGQGSPTHVWATHVQTIAGTSFQFVPYRGAAAAMQELVAGRVELSGLEAPFTLP
jgi:hypothetical protein